MVEHAKGRLRTGFTRVECVSCFVELDDVGNVSEEAVVMRFITYANQSAILQPFALSL